jgi:hypothetical protein
MLVFVGQVSGALAMWAVRQSPYACPDNLEAVVRRFAELFPRGKDEFERQTGIVQFSDRDALYGAIQATSEQIPELLAWNERRNGEQGPGFVTRYDKPDPDNDFIDLHALWGNMVRTVVAEEAEYAEAA